MSPLCARLLGGALFFTLLAVVGLGGPAASSTTDPAGPSERSNGAPPTLVLVHQSQWVTPSDPDFTIEVGTGPQLRPVDQLQVRLTLYSQIATSSAFERSLSTDDESDQLDQTAELGASELGVPGRPEDLRVRVTAQPTDASGTSGGGQGTLDLGCPTADCSGVYPLVLSVSNRSSGVTVARLHTFLTFAAAPSPDKLLASWILPFSGTTTAAPTTGTVRISAAGVQQLAGVASSLESSLVRVPVTVEAVPRTIQALAASPSPLAARAVGDLSELSLSSHGQLFPSQTYVPIEPGTLVTARLPGEVQQQLSRAEQVLTDLRTPIQTLSGTWIAGDDVGQDPVAGLVAVHADQLVVRQSSLSSVDEETISQPFQLPVGGGVSVRAVAADQSLTRLFTSPGNPVLAATRVLADLAFIHLELPYPEQTRGVVAEPPQGWHPDPALVRTMVQGLGDNPFVQPISLSRFFSTVPEGGNGQAVSRSLVAGSSAMAGPLSAAIRSGRARLTAFSTAAAKAPAVLSGLGDQLLASESSVLDPARAEQAVGLFETNLSAQLAQVQLATDRTITLTSGTAALPIAILSTAPYPLTGTITLHSAELDFPNGNTRTIPIIRSTNPVRIPVRARTSGDLPVEVVLTTPDGSLVMTHGRITVRSTTASLAGIVLSVVALVVLLAWWARTSRSRRRRRRTEEPVIT